MPTARQGGRASGIVAVASDQVIRQGRGGGEGIGIKAGHGAGAVRELASAEKGKSLVVVLRLVLPVQERRQVRQDHVFGLAAEHVQGNSVNVAHLIRAPVVRQDGRREGFASFI